MLPPPAASWWGSEGRDLLPAPNRVPPRSYATVSGAEFEVAVTCGKPVSPGNVGISLEPGLE